MPAGRLRRNNPSAQYVLSLCRAGLQSWEFNHRRTMNPDPLFVCNPKAPCPICNGDRDRLKRRNCQACDGSGYFPVNLNGMWGPSAAFMVCGGPSLKTLPIETLSRRGIVSLAVNQVASVVPVTAWTFGDPAEKFHHGLHLDPKMITFAPLGKLRHPLNAKLPDGQWRQLGLESGKEKLCLRDTPTVFGYSRDSLFEPSTFLTTTYAHWGGVPFHVPNVKKRDGLCPRPCCQDGGRLRDLGKVLHCDTCNGDYRINDKGDQFEFQHEKTHCLASMMLGFRLLHYLGCPRIYLLGVDLWMTDEQPYAFAQSKKARNGRYNDENEMCHQIQPMLEAAGMQVFNCNPMSKCDAFPLASFEDAVADCQGGVPQEPFDTADWYNKSIAEAHIKANPQPITPSQLARLQREPHNVQVTQIPQEPKV